MGGSAFQALLVKEAFPRIPGAVYNSLKARIHLVISELYSHVATPVEAPEKVDFGDVDFLVTGPKPCSATQAAQAAIPHAVVQEALGARHAIPMDANRTSNYAIPVNSGEWEPFGYIQEERAARSSSPNSEIFYQIDIHVCQDLAELDRFKFFHSYGDMGMMLGLVARNAGLRLGANGLKIPTPSQPPFPLSESFEEILPFLGLDVETYNSGFKTKVDIFHWVCSMRFFEPRIFRSTGPGFTKVKAERKMYSDFVSWVEQGRSSGNLASIIRSDADVLSAQAQNEALIHFKKASEYHALAEARSGRIRLRKTFSGHNVRDWTDMGEHWKGVKRIMDAMRIEMGGEGAILQFLDENGEEALRTIAIRVRDQLDLSPFVPDQGLSTNAASPPSLQIFEV